MAIMVFIEMSSRLFLTPITHGSARKRAWIFARDALAPWAVTAAPASPDLSHVDTWIFDLDNTLYPPSCDLFALIDDRMQAFVQRKTGLEPTEARALQKRYYHQHGTTLAGLMANHGVEPREFLDEVHDIALDRLAPDPELAAALARLPGRRLVFTNGSQRHAERVMEAIGIDHLFDEIFDIEASRMIPKPQVAAFEAMMARHGVTPATSAFFEDLERNLEPGAQLGMTTILVGPHAADSTAAFVDYRTEHLAPFLAAARLKETA
jgi:putative hydrolase of the HAD superfamily